MAMLFGASRQMTSPVEKVSPPCPVGKPSALPPANALPACHAMPPSAIPRHGRTFALPTRMGGVARVSGPSPDSLVDPRPVAPPPVRAPLRPLGSILGVLSLKGQSIVVIAQPPPARGPFRTTGLAAMRLSGQPDNPIVSIAQPSGESGVITLSTRPRGHQTIRACCSGPL